MNRFGSRGLSIAFVASFLMVGIPYWSIPYNKVDLPDALMGPGLLGVVMACMALRLYGIAPFWRVVVVIGLSVPGAVFARVIADGISDATSHNLWPFEIVIASAVGFPCALSGAIIGNLLAKARTGQLRSSRRQGGGERLGSS